MAIAWTISIVQKNSVAIATCLEEFNFLAPVSQRVYIVDHNLHVHVHVHVHVRDSFRGCGTQGFPAPEVD